MKDKKKKAEPNVAKAMLDKEDMQEEGQELCPKCGNIIVEEDGEKTCSSCSNEIDFFGEEDDGAEGDKKEQ